MTTAYSTLLGLALPVTGELSGTWGDMVDNGITSYLDISVAGTVTLTNDGAVTLSNTNGTSAATNIVSSLTGAGTASAQFAIIKVTGTLTTPKVITAPSTSKTYLIVNSATGSTVTLKASGQTGISIAVGETAIAYFNGTDYVKISSTVSSTNVASITFGSTGLTPSTATTGAVTVAGTLATANGGTNLTSFTSGGAVYATSTSALTTGTLPNTAGGTGQSSAFTQYGITYASTTTALATTAAGTSTTVLHGNASGAPTFGAVSLTADVSGTLPAVNGGTGQSSFTVGDIFYANTTTTIAKLGIGTTGQVVTVAAGIPSWATPASFAYPGAGIANSTGSAWGTSYTTTGSGTVVALATSPTLVTPALGTPTSGVATNLTGLPLTTGVTGTLPVANGGTGVTSSTGSGNVVLSTSPTLVTPVLGTPSSGTLSSCTVDGTNSVGYLNIPINSQSAAYTLVLADSGKAILHPSTDANARTFTIPANGSVAFAIGTAVTFINMTSQVVSIAITTDTLYLGGTGTTGTRSLAQYGTATCIKMTSTTWIINGSGLT
jgi:hypothetical protein